MHLSCAIVTAALVLPSTSAAAANFTLSSPDLRDGGRIAEAQVLAGSGCRGANRSPALSWSGVPAGAKSLAVTVYDPDAPTGSGWWHWVVFNLPADTAGLPAGAGDPKAGLMPAGAVQSRTDFGTPGYGGPCPPPGRPHHYAITVYALDVERLALDADAPGAMVGFQIHGHSLGSASLTGLYGR